MGILAQPNLPIFQAGNGQPLNLDNLARRVIAPVAKWHGWHGFRRGLATNLHALGVDDKTIQAILRHSNIGNTQMDSLSEKLGICNDHATSGDGPIN